MIVIVKQAGGDDLFIEDVAAVVRSRGFLRLCRDGREDEYIGNDIDVVVVNDG